MTPNLTLEQLSSLKPTQNLVLVKTNRGTHEYRLPSGERIFIDIQFEKEIHAPVTGTVVAVPDTLHVGSEESPGMQWETDMELQVGDDVVYSYLAAMAALDTAEGRMIISEGEVYFFIPYEECFVAKRRNYKGRDDKHWMLMDELGNTRPETGRLEWTDDLKTEVKFTSHFQIIPLNGYCLVSPVEDQHRSFLIQAESQRGKSSSTYGRIAHVGSLVRRYADGDGLPDTDNVNPGDVISFDIGADLLTEYHLHASLQGSNMFYRIQRRNINGIVR